MVRTRNSGGADDLRYDTNVPVPSPRRRRRFNQPDYVNGYDSDGYEEIAYQPSPRATRGRRYRLEEDDSPLRPTSRSRYSRESPDEFDEPTAPRRRNRNSNNSRRTSPAAGDQGVVRRSSRQRKSLYSTYNQNDIDKHYELMTAAANSDVESRQSKRRKIADDDKESLDMYTRVKRERNPVKRDMYGIPFKDGKDTNSEESENTAEGETDDDETASETEEEGTRQYNLREHKPRTNHYIAPTSEPKTRRRHSIFHDAPTRSGRKSKFHSPARRKATSRKKHKRYRSRLSPEKLEAASRRDFVLSNLKKLQGKREAYNGSDTTSSSDEGGDMADRDERHFERRKAKSLAKARNKFLPMNFDPKEAASGVVRERQRIGASLADIDPMIIDRQITFESVGGLGPHIQKLKEMVVFPMLYPDYFKRLNMAPPRGCLFYGPPGTGKTHMARALANECSHGEKRVAFFMRKGADCLSKWVGESERQLRALFDQAHQFRPSIIFFDEIDGLAPVRSSRQDQIHSSIVSTLLALMDGMDDRGEVIVIGATNRIDAIDPALRRPGRFDRELEFPLPSKVAREHILSIHTKSWTPAVDGNFLKEFASRTDGYCGADLKSACMEAALVAFRRTYPQVYTSKDKLVLDYDSIKVTAKDFHRALQTIVPAAHRVVSSPARSLTPIIQPLLQATLDKCIDALMTIFPRASNMRNQVRSSSSDGTIDLDLCSESDDEGESILEVPNGKKPRKFFHYATHAYHEPATFRPRLLLVGEQGQGQTTYLAPAVLQHLEGIPVHTLDLPALHSNTAVAAEEALAQIIREAKRTSPCIIYMPHIHQWWASLTDACRSTFLTLLSDIPPESPILVVATAEVQYKYLNQEVGKLFSTASGEVVTMQNPTESQRREYFEDLLIVQAVKPPSTKKHIAKRVLQHLPVAPPPEPRQLSEAEKQRAQTFELNTMRELRIFLRQVLNKLGRDRKFQLFSRPVTEEEAADYYQIIKNPMDLETMMNKIDLDLYQTVADFLVDIDLICSNALEYNPDKPGQSRAIRHRALALQDTANAIITAELEPEFEKHCQEIKAARIKRGETKQTNIPAYYFTKPLTRQTHQALGSISGVVTTNSPQKSSMAGKETVEIEGKTYYKVYKSVVVKRSGAASRSRSPWCKPSRRNRRRMLFYVDVAGNEYPASHFEGHSEAENEGANDAETDAEPSPDASQNEYVELNGKRYRKVVRRKRMKRAGSSSSKSPWCKSSKPRFHNVVFLVDDEGNEIEESKLRNENGDSDAGSEASQPRSINSPLKVDVNTRSHSPHGSRGPSMSPASRSVRTHSTNCSPRILSPDKTPQKSPRAKSRSKSRSRSRSRSQERERSKTPQRMVNGVTPKKEDGMDTIDEVASGASSDNCACSEATPARRVTRSVDLNTQKAMEILNAKQPEFIINKDKLKKILARAVQITAGFNIERLQRVYSHLSLIMYQHRNDYNKNKMVSELEHAIERQK